MNKTILSSQQSRLLDKLMVKYGQIATSGQILSEAKEWWDYNQAKNIITKLVKNGWLIRLKQGLYSISDLSSRGFSPLSQYLIANLLSPDSYVSFESALAYHNFFDQLVGQVVSVARKANKEIELQNIKYSFVKTKTDYFFGWKEFYLNDKMVRIAEPEKALLDMINFHRSKYAVDLAIEKIKEHKKDLDFAKFNLYAAKFPDTVIKILGLIFDWLNIDSSRLFEAIKNKRGTHRMFSGDKKFNAKWRLYYDEYFDKYKT